MAKMLNCDIEVSEFEILALNNVFFRTNTFEKAMDPLIPLLIGLTVSFLFFYKDCFGIWYPIKVYLLLNKGTKQ